LENLKEGELFEEIGRVVKINTRIYLAEIRCDGVE
jgi:hypothetical protein